MITTEPTTGPGDATRWAIGVVDVENDFCEGGSLAVDGGAAVAERIRAWIEAEPRRWVARFATADRHPADLPGHFAPAGQEPNFVDTWPPHCVAGTPGAELHPNLVAATTETALFDVLVEKGQHTAAYSGFEGTTPDGDTLAAWLRERAVDGVELVGIATDHCVRATAADALREGFRVRVVTDLCVGITPASVETALDELRAAGAEIVTTADLLETP
jgi:nicotinamidase/pyrazinamidase